MLFPSSYFSVQWISFPSHLNSLLCYSAATRRHALPFLCISALLTSAAAHRIANQFPIFASLGFSSAHHRCALLRHSNSTQLNAQALQGVASLLPRMALLLYTLARQISAMLLPCIATLFFATLVFALARLFFATLFFAIARLLFAMCLFATPVLSKTPLFLRDALLCCAYPLRSQTAQVLAATRLLTAMPTLNNAPLFPCSTTRLFTHA